MVGGVGAVVAGVDDDLAVAFDAEAEAALGVVELAGDDADVVEVHPLFADFMEMPLGGHGFHIHGEVRVGHLAFQGALQALVFKAVGIKEELVAGTVKGFEEGDALDVVPMKVREEDAGVDGALAELAFEGAAQEAEAGAAVKEEELAAGRAEFDAGGVAADAGVFRLGGGGGAAYAPETNQHSILCLCLSAPSIFP